MDRLLDCAGMIRQMPPLALDPHVQLFLSFVNTLIDICF